MIAIVTLFYLVWFAYFVFNFYTSIANSNSTMIRIHILLFIIMTSVYILSLLIINHTG
jgi:hypothetical protein